ncbi:hemin-degrading factor [Sneathiella sp.]|jgi:putative hemin transport protein|uniref:hemin-degrading factor n=1 Tax=Sneathiella sp. TaxID=1964365 RepID=UPI0039E5C8AF
MNAEQIKNALVTVREENPGIRARDAAQEIGISEAELLAAQVGNLVVRLNNEPIDILKALEAVGEVMALSRNEHCVHERKGVYKDLKVFGKGAAQHVLMINPDIDLRIFISNWTFVFAVLQDGDTGPRSSLQFFDKEGAAIHKVYLTEASNTKAFASIVKIFTADDQTNPLDIQAYEKPAPQKEDGDINWPKFREHWEKMQDVHEFFPLLRKFKISRLQGHRHIGEDFARKVPNSSAQTVLELAASNDFEIMVFVGNRGIVQIHTGQINTLKEYGAWYNILDPKFNLHLDQSGIAETWITRKPTKDGLISSMEVFDKNGDLIVTFFGKRQEGNPEQALWREILAEITDKEAQNAA